MTNLNSCDLVVNRLNSNHEIYPHYYNCTLFGVSCQYDFDTV